MAKIATANGTISLYQKMSIQYSHSEELKGIPFPQVQQSTNGCGIVGIVLMPDCSSYKVTYWSECSTVTLLLPYQINQKYLLSAETISSYYICFPQPQFHPADLQFFLLLITKIQLQKNHLKFIIGIIILTVSFRGGTP